MMQEDVLQKMKELVALHKAKLADYFAAQDPTSCGEVSEAVLVAGLREVGHLPRLVDLHVQAVRALGQG